MDRTEMTLFISLIEEVYRDKSGEFSLISSVDVGGLVERINYLSDNEIDSVDNMLFDPIMDPLLQTTMAHFLYHKKEWNFIAAYHPNYLRFQFMDDLVSNKKKNMSRLGVSNSTNFHQAHLVWIKRN